MVAIILIGSVFFGTMGIIPNSLWLGKLIGDASGERYPCEGGRCGCLSAKQCWTTCGCHTLQQKVAWAQRNGVPIPDFVDLSSIRYAEAPSKPACPLCVTHEDDGGNSEEVAADEGPSGLPTLSPFGCRGIELLLVFAPVMGTTSGIEWIITPKVTVRLEGIPDDQAPDSRGLDPSTPPPRSLVSSIA